MNKVFDDFEWKNDPDTSSPVSAQNLNKMNRAIDMIDDRVCDLSDRLDTMGTCGAGTYVRTSGVVVSLGDGVEVGVTT